jgi:hypothetical protein
MLAEVTRLVIAAAALGFFPDDVANSEALRYVEQARRVVINSKQEGGKSDAAYHSIAVGYALAHSDEAAWKTIDKIWSPSTTVSALARLSVVFGKRGDRPQAESASSDALGWAASDAKKIATTSWHDVAIARIWLDDDEGAAEIARKHIGGINLARVVEARMKHGDPHDALRFTERILGRALQKDDIYLLRALSECAAESGTPDVAAEIARKAAELIRLEMNDPVSAIDAVCIAGCYWDGALPLESLRFLKEAERLVYAQPGSRNGSLFLIAPMIAESYAALGDKNWAVVQAGIKANQQIKSDLLARAAVGLARGGRFEEAYEMVSQIDSRGLTLDFDGWVAMWKIGEIAAGRGRPEIAVKAILEFATPPESLPERKELTVDNIQAGVDEEIALLRLPPMDSEGESQRAMRQGLLGLCKALGKMGKPDEALNFLERIGGGGRLKPNDRAAAIVSIAEGITAAESEREKRPGN